MARIESDPRPSREIAYYRTIKPHLRLSSPCCLGLCTERDADPLQCPELGKDQLKVESFEISPVSAFGEREVLPKPWTGRASHVSTSSPEFYSGESVEIRISSVDCRPGEICPLGLADANGTFTLPPNLRWAPAAAPCAGAAPETPACCSSGAVSYCQYILDLTPQGKSILVSILF